jgi:hypothetical protein
MLAQTLAGANWKDCSGPIDVSFRQRYRHAMVFARKPGLRSAAEYSR